jgi:hypothetical protein
MRYHGEHRQHKIVKRDQGKLEIAYECSATVSCYPTRGLELIQNRVIHQKLSTALIFEIMWTGISGSVLNSKLLLLHHLGF